MDHLPHKRRQTFGALAEVHRLRRHHHPNRAARSDHAFAFKARITAATVAVWAPGPVRATTPSISSSIAAEPDDLGRRGRFASGGAGISETAGTNTGVSAPTARACRRQVKSCCAVSPCRRATAHSVSPSTELSAMILAFSSGDQFRRRPAPVNTSIRCAGSGIGLWSEIDMCRNLRRLQASTLKPQTKRWRRDIAYSLASEQLKRPGLSAGGSSRRPRSRHPYRRLSRSRHRRRRTCRLPRGGYR